MAHFFRFHDRDGNETITKDEFYAEEAKFVILDRSPVDDDDELQLINGLWIAEGLENKRMRLPGLC